MQTKSMRPQTILEAERSALPEILTSLGRGDLETFAGLLYLLEQLLDGMTLCCPMRDPKLDKNWRANWLTLESKGVFSVKEMESPAAAFAFVPIMLRQCFHCFTSCQVCGVSLGSLIQRDIRDVLEGSS